MKFLAAFVLKGRTQAVVVTVVMAILALLLPPFSYLSGAVVALVTLRYGIRAGLQLSLLASIAAALLLLSMQLPPQLGGAFMLVLWLPVWVLATSLRRTASQARVVLLAALFGMMVLVGLLWALDDPAEWWLGVLRKLMEPMLTQLPTEDLSQVEAELVLLAAQMSGVMAAALMASLIACLLLGRWWQSLLFNPGGFGEEFRQIRLGRTMAGAVLLIVVVHLLGQLADGLDGLPRDLLALGQVAFALQGLSVVHGLAQGRNLHRGWLIGLYVLLLVVTGPLVLLLAMLGLLDSWFDFRGKFGRGTTTESN
ncbi:MAG: DUF2232 domain-containing protein [Chromatiales bacterium]|nr:DUF2232 domain-containing protein [Chromatiales bacterium]